MNVENGRRVFLGSVAAGLPLLAGAGVDLAYAQRAPALPAGRNPLLEQVRRDMRSAVAMVSRAKSGEAGRRLASSLRVLAAWGQSTDLDARVRQTMRTATARHGRDQVLWRPVSQEMFRAEARAMGFDGAAVMPLPVLRSGDVALRRRVMNDLTADGITARWTALAGQLEALAATFDQQAARQRDGGLLVAAQTGATVQCQHLSQSLFYLEVQMAFWCAPWFAWFPEGCALLVGAVLGASAMYWWNGCV